MPEFRVPSPEALDSSWSDVMDIDGPSYGEVIIPTPARRAAVEFEGDLPSQPIRMGWLSIYDRVIAGFRRITSFYSSPAGARVADIQRVAVPVGGDSRKRRCVTAEDLEEVLQEEDEEEDLWEEAPAVDEDRVYVPGWYPASPVYRRRRARANAERNAQFRSHTPEFRLAQPPLADFNQRWMSPISERSEEASFSAQISSATSTPASCGQVVESPPSCGQRVVRRAAPIPGTKHVTAGVSRITKICRSPSPRQYSPKAMPDTRRSSIERFDRESRSIFKDRSIDQLLYRAAKIHAYDLEQVVDRDDQQEAQLERLRAETASLEKKEATQRKQAIYDSLHLRLEYRQAQATDADLTFTNFKQLKLEEKSLAEAKARQQADEEAQQEAALKAQKEAADKARIEAAAHEEQEALIAEYKRKEIAKELVKRRQEARLQAKAQKDAARKAQQEAAIKAEKEAEAHTRRLEAERKAQEHAATLAAKRAELVAKQDAARKAADEAAARLQQEQQQAKRDAEAAELQRRQAKAERDAEAARQAQRLKDQEEQHWSGFEIGAPLPGDWDQKIHDILNASNDPQEVLCTTERPRFEVRRLTLQRMLADGNTGGYSSWLDDDGVNAWLATVCQARNTARAYIPQNSDTRPPFYVAFNSAWLATVRNAGNISAIRGWTRRQKISGQQLLKSEFIFWPVNTGSHWTLMAIEPTYDDDDEPEADGFIHYYDSLGGSGDQIVAWGRAWLQDQLGDVYRAERWKRNRARSSRQNNANDCGVFTCMNALVCALDETSPSHFVQAGMMSNSRKQMVAILLNGGFKGDFALNVLPPDDSDDEPDG
ncbi:hypothetical protein AMS68_005222 [Peltaster fructicola]|uniref:Ubiquitin-like protease family profile domain-containing protein n=1 Tax=Peltaster fructicola TaxID=286661 RepID=A0A6H0XYG7_9PEZI|nr:hypothetical protein AMS68_005222 [Peltaster fructicola]